MIYQLCMLFLILQIYSFSSPPGIDKNSNFISPSIVTIMVSTHPSPKPNRRCQRLISRANCLPPSPPIHLVDVRSSPRLQHYYYKTWLFTCFYRGVQYALYQTWSSYWTIMMKNCIQCHSAHTKCVIIGDSTSCVRCTKMHFQCVFRASLRVGSAVPPGGDQQQHQPCRGLILGGFIIIAACWGMTRTRQEGNQPSISTSG